MNLSSSMGFNHESSWRSSGRHFLPNQKARRKGNGERFFRLYPYKWSRVYSAETETTLANFPVCTIDIAPSPALLNTEHR
jgi:hypothetical protein